MTKAERDQKNLEKKRKMAQVLDMGGISLPISRGGLLKGFWLFAAGFLGWLFWESRGQINGETVLVTMALSLTCFLPAWLWCTGRVSGLPIFPVFGLSFLPTYVIPLWRGGVWLSDYSEAEIATAGWTVAGFLLVSTLIWQQICVRAQKAPAKIFMIERVRSEWILMGCLIAQTIFEIGIYFFKDLGEGIFPILRSFAASAGRLGLFIFSYQIGKKELSKGYTYLFVALTAAIVIRQTSSLLLSTVFATIGVLFAGFILGRGKIPWGSLALTVFMIGVLQLGKVEMREKYFEGEKTFAMGDTLGFFTEWISFGFKNMGFGSRQEGRREDARSVTDRGSLIQVMLRIQQKTPSQLPYLEGATYRYIPEMLIPRIFNKEKVWAHAGNMILSVYYEFLEREQIFKTSIAFDPIIEAYANFGYPGVFVFAVVMGILIGAVTAFSCRVPMLSFGFLFGVQLLAVLLASFNTTGVLVTSLWQSFLSLVGLSLILMKKLPNPLFVSSRAGQRMEAQSERERDPTSHKASECSKREGGREVEDRRWEIGDRETEDRGLRTEDGGFPSSQSPTTAGAQPEAAQVRHERPQRFVYRKGNG